MTPTLMTVSCPIWKHSSALSCLRQCFCVIRLQLPVRQTSALTAFGDKPDLHYIFAKTFDKWQHRRISISINPTETFQALLSSAFLPLRFCSVWIIPSVWHTGTSLNYGWVRKHSAEQTGIMLQRNTGREDVELEKVEKHRTFIWVQDWTIFLKTTMEPHLFSKKTADTLQSSILILPDWGKSGVGAEA